MTVTEYVNKLYAMAFPKKDEAKADEKTPEGSTTVDPNAIDPTKMAGDTPPPAGDVEARIASLEDAVNKILQMLEALNGNANATAMKAELEKVNGELNKFSAELESLKASADGEIAGKDKKVAMTIEPNHVGVKRLIRA